MKLDRKFSREEIQEAMNPWCKIPESSRREGASSQNPVEEGGNDNMSKGVKAMMGIPIETADLS